MDNSRFDMRPSREAFLAAILGEDRSASSAAFAAAILCERSLDESEDEKGRRTKAVSHEDWLDAVLHGASEGSDPFAADVLREYSPDQPRDDWGRWTTGGSDDERPEERRQEILRALTPKGPAPGDDRAAKPDANSAVFGMRKFTSRDGLRHFNAQFAGFDKHGHVLLKKAGQSETFVATPEYFSGEDRRFLADLAKLRGDQGFQAGWDAKPANIHLDSSGLHADKKLAWEAQVIRDIGKLRDLESGKALLKSAEAQGKDITVQPRNPAEKDNFARGGTVHFDPEGTEGARARSGSKERPPFIGLGQELFNARANLLPGIPAPTAQKEENGLRFGQQLRVEYNRTIDDAGRLKELTGRYSAGTPYRGWGTKKVDEEVLGLDGRPLPGKRYR